MYTVGAAPKLELLWKESTHALLRRSSVNSLVFLFLFFFWDLKFCSVLSGAMFVLEFSRSGVIRDGRCVTEHMQCFRRIMVPHMVFVFF